MRRLNLKPGHFQDFGPYTVAGGPAAWSLDLRAWPTGFY